MWVGYDGKGTLNITNGGLVTTLIGGFIGAHPGSNGSVTVDGANPDGRKSTWTVTGGPAGLYVGGTDGSAGGTALLTVTNEGRVNAANVHVWNSGTLTGNGTVTTTNGTTTNDGTLAPSGTLTINGNLSFGQFANMRCNVSSTSVDNAQVSGTAALNGKLSVTLNGFFTGNFTLLHASTLNNQFSSYSFTYTGCLSPSIRYVDGDVILHVESSCQ
jgi:T5SS/PEP-CTERM-associated repeat protein